MLQELHGIEALLKESDPLRRVLENPSIPGNAKRAVLDAITQRLGTTRQVRNFVAVLIDNRRLPLLSMSTATKFLTCGVPRRWVMASSTARFALPGMDGFSRTRRNGSLSLSRASMPCNSWRSRGARILFVITTSAKARACSTTEAKVTGRPFRRRRHAETAKGPTRTWSVLESTLSVAGQGDGQASGMVDQFATGLLGGGGDF